MVFWKSAYAAYAPSNAETIANKSASLGLNGATNGAVTVCETHAMICH